MAITLTLCIGVISAADTRENTANTRESIVNHYSTSFTSSGTSSNTGHSEGTSTLATTTKNVKVLIYNGEYSIGVCVSGIKTGLDSANAHNLVQGYHFTYATSTIINSARLSGYDVLAMPGGADGDYYVHSSSISGTAIRNFVSSGKGYLGICAGAYSGVKQVVSSYHGNYNGWAVAPHVKATRPWVEGDVSLKIEAAGQALFGYGGYIAMAHYNGPAMYAYGGSMVTFASYADSRCNSKGLGAIVGDYYGKGRSVIVGPHPELDPKYPDILANLVVWAANKSPITTTPVTAKTATISQINSAASSVKTYYEANKALPANVTVNGTKITRSQFLNLLVRGVVNLSIGSKAAVYMKTINTSTSSGTYHTGSISKSGYVNYARTILSFININCRTPIYQTTSLGKIPFTKLVYMYSKILNFYKVNSRLPNSVSI